MSDTIAAIITAPQNAAVGIVRLSGPDARGALSKNFTKPDGTAFGVFKPRYFYFGTLRANDGAALDEVLAVYMPAPHSYTGEDVVEIHSHGNVPLLRRILREFLNCPGGSIRAAAAGEFTRRAFLNGKMDLTRAEAVHAIIAAESEAAAQASLRTLDGALSREINALAEELKTSLAFVEASFEFPEEDIQTFDRNAVCDLVVRSRDRLRTLAGARTVSRLYEHGLSVALVGRPNVGKSSLLNALLSEERAIVTDTPGTTRDVISGSKIIGGVRFVFRDTAGLRDTQDDIESIGIAKTREWIDKSDLVFWITDNVREPSPAELVAADSKKLIKILNKIDLISQKQRDYLENDNHFDCLVSAQTGAGITLLESRLTHHVQDKNRHVQNSLHVNERQFLKITAAEQILSALCRGGALTASEDVLAEELRAAVMQLQEVTGEISSDAVLGEIFKRFCIGK